MSRIGRSGPPIPPTGPDGPKGPRKADSNPPPAAADFLGKLEGAMGSTGPGPTPAAASAFAQGLQSVVADGVRDGKPRDEILDEAVQHGLREAFGEEATPEMVGSVRDAFEQHAALRTLFDRLLGQVRNES
ncbi:MAG: hypothetical protein AAF628_22940 [Planctomycetota bacterium]